MTGTSRLASVAVLFVLLLSQNVWAQSAASKPAAPPTVDPVLAELRALRADLQQTAATEILAQLLWAQMQSYDGQIREMAGELMELRRAASADGTEENRLRAFTQLQDALKDDRLPAMVRTDMDTRSAELAQSSQSGRVQTAREAQLQEGKRTAQAAWKELYGQLEQIHRELMRKAGQ
jgi:hypothetical protein